ncbi:hypothetical protein [Synechococcus sp. MIT S9507]|uniref:hypothetical protein n=1 Tax=Synechococcus sp. MIT S9507 TaxID=3082544 RepID=UPI0039B5F40B
MTPEEIKILNDCCRIAGVDASKIRAENPMSKKGSTASLLQAAAAEFHNKRQVVDLHREY